MRGHRLTAHRLAAHRPASHRWGPSRSFFALAGALCFAALGSGCSTESTDATADRSGEAAAEGARSREPVPVFDLERLGGGRVSSDDLAGKIVIVDFWATWCPPCEFQVPGLNAFHEAHRDDPDVAVFGVSVDTVGADEVSAWVTEKDARYPILLDGEDLARKVGALGFPTLLVITPDGLIDAQHVGLIESSRLDDAVDRLRAEAASPARSLEAGTPAAATGAPVADG